MKKMKQVTLVFGSTLAEQLFSLRCVVHFIVISWSLLLVLTLKKPSLCTGNTHISEDSSEIVFLLVEI